MDVQTSSGSPSEPASVGLQRKRVAKACHSCRSMKSKCDGKWPKCSRCKGYGYSCVYGTGKRNRHAPTASESGVASTTAQGQSYLREAIRQYEILLESSLSQLSSPKEREDASAILDRLKAADTAFARTEAGSNFTLKTETSAAGSDALALKQPLLQNERFHGEISDVRFFNLVKKVFLGQLGSDDRHESVDSYELDGDIPSPSVPISHLTNLPSPEKIKTYTQIYFSTVHLAFPFIPQAPFMKSLEQVMNPINNNSLANTTLALIYVICAIGAYYTSLPGAQAENTSHEIYYLQALSIAISSGIERSIDHVCLLLAQCFYLLAVCRTDSCWIVLGQTVRMAQSIGLHMEQEDAGALMSKRLLVERRRRVWSSIYVLDRLVSLQLGRPPAINEYYCHVPMPSRLGDSDIDWDGDSLPDNFPGPSTGDYHVALIGFSDIISHVLREQCSAKATQDINSELLKTKELDSQLLDWKYSLPRTLRFDLGHAFEKSFVFKRQVSTTTATLVASPSNAMLKNNQRSMFAIKYHHLRALIYRPYLCYPVLRNLDNNAEAAFAQINWPLVSMYEKVCIMEARETARLLHSIPSEVDLVQDFPWWQMISCLILAGSILLVSSIFAKQSEDVVDGMDAASTSDDAETCLKVFEALSANSTGARMARDMMERLKQYGQLWKTEINALQCQTTEAPGCRARDSQERLPVYSADTVLRDSNLTEQRNDPPGHLVTTPSVWPPELIDSMVWSSQFFGAVQPKDQI